MARNVIFQATDFNFDPTDMAFLNRYVGAHYGKLSINVLNSLRDWLRFRAFGNENHIYYDARVTSEGGNVTSLNEFILNAGEVEVMQINARRELTGEVDMRPHEHRRDIDALNHSEAVSAIDAMMTSFDDSTNHAFRGILHSLRPTLMMATNNCNRVMLAPVNDPFQVAFMFQEGDYVYTLELMMTKPEKGVE